MRVPVPAPEVQPLPTRTPPRSSEQGIALILALIFAILLYVLVAELVVSGKMVRLTGENDALLARMGNQIDFTLGRVEDSLLEDQAGAAAAGEGGAGGAGGAAGALGGALGGAAGGEGGAGGEGEQTDPAAECDSSRDSWYWPQAFADGDLTTYVWVEDENRKLNILSLWSPDLEFARLSRDRLVRLLDNLRQDTEDDLSSSDAERIVRELEEWGRRSPTEAIPRPPLKSDDEKQRELTLPLELDELLMLPGVSEDLFYDKVLDGRVILGLESVLTVWTSLGLDPGMPEKVARQQARQQQGGASAGANSGAAGSSGGTPAGSPAGTPAGTPADPNAPPPQPEGEGIRININTATRPVLRALFPIDKLPDTVLDAIIKYRNEEEEPDPDAEQLDTSEFGNLQLGDQKKFKFFAAVTDLEQIPEFANLPDPQFKTEFQAALTVKSDVFTIHLAALQKVNEERRTYKMRRARSIVVRRDNGGEGYLHPLVLHEERHGRRVMPVDQQETFVDLQDVYYQMDQFAQEERAWNPFYVDFWLPDSQREEFYQPIR